MTEPGWEEFVAEVAALSGRAPEDLSEDVRPFGPDGFDSLATSELVVFLLDAYGLDLLTGDAFERARAQSLAELYDTARQVRSVK